MTELQLRRSLYSIQATKRTLIATKPKRGTWWSMVGGSPAHLLQSGLSLRMFVDQNNANTMYIISVVALWPFLHTVRFCFFVWRLFFFLGGVYYFKGGLTTMVLFTLFITLLHFPVLPFLQLVFICKYVLRAARAWGVFVSEEGGSAAPPTLWAECESNGGGGPNEG